MAVMKISSISIILTFLSGKKGDDKKQFSQNLRLLIRNRNDPPPLNDNPVMYSWPMAMDQQEE